MNRQTKTNKNKQKNKQKPTWWAPCAPALGRISTAPPSSSSLESSEDSAPGAAGSAPCNFYYQVFFHLFLLDVHEGKNSDYDKMCETVPKQNVLNKNLFDLDVLV